jgi:glycosyltransferase involved in cell wall biosynthesis
MCYQNGIRNLVFTKRKMQSKKKIVFILPSLKAGGSERVVSFIAKQLNTDIFDIKLIVIGFEKDTVYDVGSLNIQYLNKTRLLAAITSLFVIIQKENPAIVVSSIGHITITMGLFSLFFRKIKFIGREASVQSKMNEFSKVNSNIFNVLTRIFYPRLSIIICQSEDTRQDLIKKLGINHSELVVIHNPITNSETIKRNSHSNEKIHFVTVGRLSEEKGYLRILKGLSNILNYDFHYTIIGSGPQLESIKEHSVKYNLTEKINIIQHTFKVLEEVARKDFFIQGSYVEGFPNALLESCSVGTPVIAFNAPGGTKEIVLNATNGFLVEDEREFTSILNDIDTLKSISRNTVITSVSEKFNAAKIVKQYEALFIRI